MWFHADIRSPVLCSLNENPAFKDFPISKADVEQCLELYVSPASLLMDCAKYRDKSGAIGEAGVANGTSCIHLAAADPTSLIYGFDSFDGLPMDWHLSPTEVLKKGTFSVEGLPNMPKNVELVVGLFDDAIPKWRNLNQSEFSMLHIDCDLYDSTKSFLSGLNSRILNGCLIVFDELIDLSDTGRYPNWKDHEWKALNEWGCETNRKFRVLARTSLWHVAIQIQNSSGMK